MPMLLNNDNESLTLAERMDEAIRNEFRDILQAYQETGSIPEIGETGLYFRFDTRERGVKVPEHLFEANPEELTVVLQNAFWGLEVGHEAFEVSLSFSGSAERIRVKESDRFAAIVEGLTVCGVTVAADGDDIVIQGCGGAIPGGAEIPVNLDHRIAMAFLVAGMAADAPIAIDDAAAIGTSFPGFVELMNGIGGNIGPVAPA